LCRSAGVFLLLVIASFFNKERKRERERERERERGGGGREIIRIQVFTIHEENRRMKNFAASVSMARLIRAELKIAAFCWA